MTLRTRRTALLARITGLFAQRRADTTGDVVEGLAGCFEAGYLLAGDVLLGQTLDGLDKLPFIGRDQGDGVTGSTGTTGTTDTVHVIFRHVRQLEVHYLRQLVDIEATGRDVGRHHHAHAAVLEAGQCTGTGTLALVAVNGGGTDAVFFKPLGNAVGDMLGTGKDQHLLPVVAGDQVAQQGNLVGLVARVHQLLDTLGGAVARGDFNDCRVVQQASGQLANFISEGGGEEQVLALLRQQGQDAADVADKAHVEHAIRFVQHQDLHLVKLDGILVVEIDQTARTGHQHVQTTASRHHLRVDAHATKYHVAAQGQMLAVVAHALAHLGGQLARRGQYQRTDAVRRDLALALHQTLQHRQGKACGLAGPCLGRRHQIAASQNGGDRLLLNGRRGVVALFGNGTQQGFGQTEGSKTHSYLLGIGAPTIRDGAPLLSRCHLARLGPVENTTISPGSRAKGKE